MPLDKKLSPQLLKQNIFVTTLREQFNELLHGYKQPSPPPANIRRLNRAEAALIEKIQKAVTARKLNYDTLNTFMAQSELLATHYRRMENPANSRQFHIRQKELFSTIALLNPRLNMACKLHTEQHLRDIIGRDITRQKEKTEREAIYKQPETVRPPIIYSEDENSISCDWNRFANPYISPVKSLDDFGINMAEKMGLRIDIPRL